MSSYKEKTNLQDLTLRELTELCMSTTCTTCPLCSDSKDYRLNKPCLFVERVDADLPFPCEMNFDIPLRKVIKEKDGDTLA